MKVELLNITPDPENFIGQCASICYDSKTDRESNIRRAAGCVDKGHLATLRFAHATFNISGVSRVFSHQIVRHKFLDYLQRSQRYCNEERTDAVFPMLPFDDDTIIVYAYEYCESAYKRLIQRGVKKEDARYVLPAGIMTEMNITGSFQAWYDFLKLRTDQAAQWEIREVATEIGKILYQHAPNIFKEFKPAEV